MAFALLGVALLMPGPALGATTVTPFTASKLAVHSGTNPLPAVTVVASGALRVTAAISGDPRAGAQTAGARGAAGTDRVLPVCLRAVCNDSYRGAGAARLVVGHYAVWLELTLTQPPRATGTPFGFDVELAVKTTAGWFFVIGYFSSGTTTAAVGHTIHLNLLIDLRTAVAPTILAVDSALAACRAAVRCP